MVLQSGGRINCCIPYQSQNYGPLNDSKNLTIRLILIMSDTFKQDTIIQFLEDKSSSADKDTFRQLVTRVVSSSSRVFLFRIHRNSSGQTNLCSGILQLSA